MKHENNGKDVCAGGDARSEMLRALPSVDALAGELVERGWEKRVGRGVIVDAARKAVEAERARIVQNGAGGAGVCDVSRGGLADAAEAALDRAALRKLVRVINATGILLHTGLGRAPMADAAVRAVTEIAGRYAPVELDLVSGKRGRREQLVVESLRRLTGAESATVVNNNAAALMLCVAALADGREVIVSRGELVEIGGSFRLPSVIEAAGAVMREVGTTNRTRASDFADAINEKTGAILKVHASNYRIEGFTAEASIEELVEIGEQHDVPVLHDIGSGALTRRMGRAVPGEEPDAESSVRAGADLTFFSGDKLLGGPQCGIVVGKSQQVARVMKHPLMRALRVDKLRLGALAATLDVHMDHERAMREIPAMLMLAPVEDLRARAEALCAKLSEIQGVELAEVRASEAHVGGGSTPARVVESFAVALRLAGASESESQEQLRWQKPGVIARANEGMVLLDLRSVFADEEAEVVEAVRHAAAHFAGRRGGG